MWLLWMFSSALAAPVGDPVPHPSLGSVSVRLVGDVEQVGVRDRDCAGAEPCDGLWSSSLGGIEVQRTLGPGLGVALELGYADGRVQEANFRGYGSSMGLSVKGALPLKTRLWLTGQARVDGTALWGGSGTEDSREFSREVVGTVTGLLAWTELDEGPTLYAGAQSSLLWLHTVYPLGYDDPLSMPMRPRFPVSGVAGLSFRSKPLGLPWERSARVTIGIEGRIGQAAGLGSWVSLSW